MEISTLPKISVIGGGAMGCALVSGLLNRRAVLPTQILISTPHPLKLTGYCDKGVLLTDENIEAAKFGDVIFIAVKPWIVQDVISEIEPYLNTNTEICFILAGINSEDLKKMFKDPIPSNFCISMPNTAMEVGESMTFIVNVNGNSKLSKNILEKVGKVKFIPERLLPAATALASCGLAYAMRYVRAACEGGVELGFKASEGLEIVNQTLAGTVALLREPGAHPEVEIDKVTTPGGLTIKGLNAMEKAGFSNAVIQGLKAGR